MIRKEEVYKIGIINKPHGIKGEVSFTFTDDIFDRVDCDYLVLLLVNALCRSFLDDFWQGFLCGMALVCFLYAFRTLVLFFKRNFGNYGNS